MIKTRQRPAKDIRIDRLGQMRIHSGGLRIPYIFFIGIGSHRKNRYRLRIRSCHCTDRFRSRYAIHNRHHYVHEHSIKRSGRIVHKGIDCFLPVHRRRDNRPFFFQNTLSDLQIQFDIFHKQYLHPFDVAAALCFYFIFPDIFINVNPNLYDKLRSDIQSAFHRDRAAHKINELLGDRHTESRSFIGGSRPIVFLCKGFEYMRQKFCFHADPRIRQFKMIQYFLVRTFLFLHTEEYFTAIRGKFHGIPENIDKYLAQMQFIPYYKRMGKCRKLPYQFDIPCCKLSADNRSTVIDTGPDIKALMIHLGFPGFNTAHIKHIIDQTEQMLGRTADLFQTVQNLILISDILQRDIRHAHDTVDRRSYVMTHIGKEITFGLTGAVRFLRRLP